MTIDIDCSYAPQDYVRSQYLHMKPRRWLYFFVAGFVLFLIIVFAAATYLVPSPADEPRPHVAASLSFATWAWIVGGTMYLVVYFGVYIPWRARRLFAQTKELHSPIRFSFSDEGITAESANGQGIWPWDHILKWRENRELFLLYPNEAMFHMIPKRCVAGDATVAALRALLGSHAKRMG